MPRPGFYNDNEYRAYPFINKTVVTVTTAENLPTEGSTQKIYVTTTTNKKYYWTGDAYVEITSATPQIPNSVVVDAGVVMGLDADFDAEVHSVWLAQVQLVGGALKFTFATDAPAATGTPLVFSRSPQANTWETEFAETGTAIGTAPCATEPIWEGFLTTGTLAGFAANLTAGQTVTFTKNQHQLEPARIQNLAKSYLRSISLGNFARTKVPACDTVNTLDRPIVLNVQCVTGAVRLKEGYHCSITQTDRANELIVSAGVNSGLATDEELCAAGSEIPLYAGEAIPEDSKFYGGGPTCAELITTINGLNGKYINIVGGAGVQIGTSSHKITVALNTNSQNNCVTP